mmetsp:Transcript_46988/g.132567  ORF Transcript_46988/g.132567 Transcript_46988/m.132567 type:complete len:209 (+) Transcript_46988:450-1076(+)
MPPYRYLHSHPRLTIQPVLRGIRPMLLSGCFQSVLSRMTSKKRLQTSTESWQGRWPTKDRRELSMSGYVQRTPGGERSLMSCRPLRSLGSSQASPKSLGGSSRILGPLPLPPSLSGGLRPLLLRRPPKFFRLPRPRPPFRKERRESERERECEKRRRGGGGHGGIPGYGCSAGGGYAWQGIIPCWKLPGGAMGMPQLQPGIGAGMPYP